MKDGLNPRRKRLLQKLFIKKMKLEKEIADAEKAIRILGREYWKEEGYRILPNTGHKLYNEVFKEERT